MVRVYVRHQVSDYRAWRDTYDDFTPTAASMGRTGEAVYRALDDANGLTVSQDFETREAAEAFVGSDELRAAMGRAGVVGEPTIWLVTEA